MKLFDRSDADNNVNPTKKIDLNKKIDLKALLSKDVVPKKKRTGNLISIDIGSRSIKFLVGEYVQNKFKVSLMKSVDFENDVYDLGFVKDEQAIIDTIKDFITKNGIKERDVVLSVESSDIMRREMSIPVMEKDLALSTIKFEIGEFLPIDIEKYIIQYTEIGRFEDNGSEKVSILVYAFPENLAKQYFDIIESTHLNPCYLDIQSNCIEKLFFDRKINGITTSDSTVAIVDIGNIAMNLTILKEGKSEFNRVVRGNTSIRKALIEDNVCTEEEVDSVIDRFSAENIFTNEISGSNINIQEEIIYIVDLWISDILKLFQYYTSRKTGNKIDNVFIYGGGSRIKNIELYIGSRIGIPTRTITSIEDFNVPYSSVDKDVSKYVNCISAIVGR